jgi:hypothetical protein
MDASKEARLKVLTQELDLDSRKWTGNLSCFQAL